MSEAVTVPRLMMMTSTVSEESFVRDRHTDRETDTYTQRLRVIYVKVCFANNNKTTDMSFLFNSIDRKLCIS